MATVVVLGQDNTSAGTSLTRSDQGEKQLGGDAFRSSIVSAALAHVGKPYIFGATGPDAFDCSGLVYSIYGAHGITIKRSAAEQYHSNDAEHIDVAQLQPGDLVFKQNTYKPGISHVGIYIGDGKLVEAKGSAFGIILSSLQDWQKSDYWAGAARYSLSRSLHHSV